MLWLSVSFGIKHYPESSQFCQTSVLQTADNIRNLVQVNSPSARGLLWDFTDSQRRKMHMYPHECLYPHMQTHTHPPPKYTYTHPYVCPHCWHKTPCSSPIRISTALMAAQCTELCEEGDWPMDLTSTVCTTLPYGNISQIMANSVGHERRCSHFSCLH